MLRKFSMIIWMSVLTIFVSCNESVNPNENNQAGYSVSGIVSQANVVVSGADVQIDNDPLLKTITDVDGFFAIENVPRGDHLVVVSGTSPESGGAPLSQIYNVSVEDDIFLDYLRLPVPVEMHEALVDRATITVSWSPSTLVDFREYKVFRGLSAGLDDETGELILIATGRADTTFTEPNPLDAGTYFYRVYVMNEYGKVGGSNIVSATVAPTRLLVTITYQGDGTVDALHPLNFGLSSGLSYMDYQGLRVNNNGGVSVVDFSSDYYRDWLYYVVDDSTYGPFYIASYFDIHGENLWSSSTLPSGSPRIVYEGIDPDNQLLATPIYLSQAMDTNVDVSYGDNYLVP